MQPCTHRCTHKDIYLIKLHIDFHWISKNVVPQYCIALIWKWCHFFGQEDFF
uniref:Uncharacterized protein n=1 Tax=Anguilla anguilla TaxID=7936 RepID=A0A0E9XRS0_ANGAN